MTTIMWTCGVKVTDKFTCSKLRDRLGIDHIITVVQQHRLKWYGHVLRKNKNDWIKNAWIMKWKVQDLEAGQRKLELRSRKKIVITYKYAKKMLWTINNGGS